MNDEYIVLFNSDSWMNINKRKTLKIELMEAWIKFFMVFTPILLLVSIIEGSQSIYRGMILLPINLTVVWIKNKITSRKKFFLYNLALISLIYMIFPSFNEKLVYLAAQSIISIKYMVDLDSENISFWKFGTLLANGVLFSIYMVLALNIKTDIGKGFVTMSAIGNIILLLIYFHIVRRNSVLAWQEKGEIELSSGMKNTSKAVIAMISITLIILNLMMWKLGFFYFMDSLFSGFKFPAISNSINPATIIQEQEQMREQQIVPPLEEMLSNTPPNKVAAAVVRIIGLVLMIIAAVVVMYGIFTIIIRIKTYFRRLMGKRDDGEKREAIVEERDVLNNLKINISAFRQGVSNIFDVSNEKKIRQLYKKIVRKYKSKGMVPQKYNTAGDISSKIEVISNKSYKDATELYRKARYAKEKCSDEDVRLIKKSLQ